MEELIEKLREAVKYNWTVKHTKEVKILNDIGKPIITISKGLIIFSRKVCLHYMTLALIQAIAEKQAEGNK